MELNGKTDECIYLTEEEKEAINLFRKADENILEFIKEQAEYIETLEDALHGCIFRLEEVEYATRQSKEAARKVANYRPLSLEEIRKNAEEGEG